MCSLQLKVAVIQTEVSIKICCITSIIPFEVCQAFLVGDCYHHNFLCYFSSLFDLFSLFLYVMSTVHHHFGSFPMC
jgi:hypothetical protein